MHREIHSDILPHETVISKQHIFISRFKKQFIPQIANWLNNSGLYGSIFIVLQKTKNDANLLQMAVKQAKNIKPVHKNSLKIFVTQACFIGGDP